MTPHVSRRAAIKGISAFSAAQALGIKCACAQQLIGCYAIDPDDLKQSTTEEFFFAQDNSIKPNSGDADLDRALAVALTTLRDAFAVTPQFGFFDDQQFVGGNAGASKPKPGSASDGTVVFGMNLLQNMMSHQDPGAAVLAVCAHEFGHIVSYKLKLDDQLVPDRSLPLRGEQYADYLAGFFAGQRKLLNPTYPAFLFLNTLGSLAGGDHGTKDQREEAVYEGYKDAHDNRLTMAAGVYKGATWAKSRPLA